MPVYYSRRLDVKGATDSALKELMLSRVGDTKASNYDAFVSKVGIAPAAMGAVESVDFSTITVGRALYVEYKGTSFALSYTNEGSETTHTIVLDSGSTNTPARLLLEGINITSLGYRNTHTLDAAPFTISIFGDTE